MARSLELPDPRTEIGAVVAVALACCDEADALSMASFRRGIAVEEKPDSSFVTAADRAVEQAVRARIVARFPDHGLVGEEYGERPGESGRRWFIDPIDGTHNYMRGIPVFATLLALEMDGRLVVGAVSAPALRRRWLAWKGGGAWAIDLAGGPDPGTATRLHVSGIHDLRDASLVYSSVPGIVGSGLAPGFAALLGEVWRDRGLGDFWGYMLVAEGAVEAMLEAELQPWDLAAPRLIVEEAGGRLTDFEGAARIDGGNALSSNGFLHDELLDVLRG